MGRGMPTVTPPLVDMDKRIPRTNFQFAAETARTSTRVYTINHAVAFSKSTNSGSKPIRKWFPSLRIVSSSVSIVCQAPLFAHASRL